MPPASRLIAYASAYLKCYYLAAFTAAMLNNQPMGFYSPATLVKDAQRHGLRMKPIDVTRSEWPCTLERHGRRDLRAAGTALRERTCARKRRRPSSSARAHNRLRPSTTSCAACRCSERPSG